MSNGELQPSPVRKSLIKKGIQRTLSTAKFETLVIYDEIEETIEWKTLEERDSKARNWETYLIDHFKKTQEQVLKELNLQTKHAYFKDPNDKDDRPDPHGAFSAEEATLDSFDVLK